MSDGKKWIRTDQYGDDPILARAGAVVEVSVRYMPPSEIYRVRLERDGRVIWQGERAKMPAYARKDLTKAMADIRPYLSSLAS